MEVVRDAVGDNCVAGIVPSLGSAADLRFVGEDVSELALAFVAPLGTEDNSDGHVPRRTRGDDERLADTAVDKYFNCLSGAGTSQSEHPIKRFARHLCRGGCLRTSESDSVGPIALTGLAVPHTYQ